MKQNNSDLLLKYATIYEYKASSIRNKFALDPFTIAFLVSQVGGLIIHSIAEGWSENIDEDIAYINKDIKEYLSSYKTSEKTAPHLEDFKEYLSEINNLQKIYNEFKKIPLDAFKISPAPSAMPLFRNAAIDTGSSIIGNTNISFTESQINNFVIFEKLIESMDKVLRLNSYIPVFISESKSGLDKAIDITGNVLGLWISSFTDINTLLRHIQSLNTHLTPLHKKMNDLYNVASAEIRRLTGISDAMPISQIMKNYQNLSLSIAPEPVKSVEFTKKQKPVEPTKSTMTIEDLSKSEFTL